MDAEPYSRDLEDIQPYRALLMDIANVPTHSGNIGVATVKGVLKIQSRTYSPLSWLETYSNAARFEPAHRKTVVLAVVSDRLDGAWRLVLNPQNIGNSSSKMDFTNMAPLTSDLIAELQLVDSHTGQARDRRAGKRREFLLKFHFVWTFDVVSNRPLI